MHTTTWDVKKLAECVTEPKQDLEKLKSKKISTLYQQPRVTCEKKSKEKLIEETDLMFEQIAAVGASELNIVRYKTIFFVSPNLGINDE